MSDFYSFIKKIRKSKGISQEEMAFRLNISFSTYSKIERGIISPNVERINDIFMVFGLPDLSNGAFDVIYNIFNNDMEEISGPKINKIDNFSFVTRKEFEYLKTQVEEIKELLKNSTIKQ